MIEYENQCMGCDWCRHCGKNHTMVCYCDKCGTEVYLDDLWDYDGNEICEDCLREMVPKTRWRYE